MADTPLVSVVIPVFNTDPKYVTDSVSSALSQTFGDLEVVVVDDGSTRPDTIDTLLALQGIHLVRQANAGVSAARNRGIREARGELIAFLDADDIWRDNKIQRQIAEMQDPEVGLCSCEFDVLQGDEVRRGWGGGGGDYRRMLRGSSVYPSCVLARRSLLLEVGCFDESLTHSEEWATWLLIAQRARLAHVPEVLVRYRVHGANASHSYRNMWRGSLRILWRHRRTPDAYVGMRRIGQVYGSQAFDAFRANRRPSDLIWASLLWPEFVVRNVFSQARRRVAHLR